MRKIFDPSSSLEHREPLGGTGCKRYELEKVPAATALKGIMLSASVHGVLGHYFRKATRPHDEENCEGCAANAPFKWVGYFFAMNPQTKVVYIVQIPPGPYPTFLSFMETYNTCRGAKFVAWRPSKTATGQVAASLTMPDNAEWMLPQCPDIKRPLDRLFYGGYKNVKFMNPANDQTPVQTHYIPDLPKAVVPIVSLPSGIVRNTPADPALEQVGQRDLSVAQEVQKILRSTRNGKGK